MKIIKLNPTSNSVRHQVKLYKGSLIRDTRFIKGLLAKKYCAYGHSGTFGNITSWHKQRGKKRLYRKLEIDNKERNSIIIGTTYDPNRSSLISIQFDLDKKVFYADLTTSKVYSGSIIQVNNILNDLRLGYRTQLKRIPAGSIIHNISTNLKSKPQYVKSAGTFAQIVQMGKLKAKIKMPSGEIMEISNESYVSIGSVSNEKHNLIVKGKAGRNRNLGRRPIVRGIAMNPVDHPHGGRTNGGRPSVTPWGLPTKGKFYLRKKNGKI